MKQLLPLLFCLAFAPVLAQQYHPFIQYGTYRDEFWAPELQICNFSYGNTYFFKGDTILGGKQYFRLLSSPIFGSSDEAPFCPPYVVDTSEYIIYALLREDTATKKVYQWDMTAQEEWLMFDFSVQAGDSVTVGYPPQTLYVADVSEELFADGTSGKKIEIQQEFNGPAFWVEGFGNVNAIWHPLAPQCICPHAFCYKQNTTALFGFACASAVAAAHEPAFSNLDLQLLPNPTNAGLQVALAPDGSGFDQIVIADFWGRVVLERRFSAAVWSADMQVGLLPAGHYLAWVSKAGKVLARKVLEKG